MKSIFNVRYQMQLGCGEDVWRIFGECEGKTIMPSCPVSYSMANDTFQTASGSVYKIENYDMDKQKFTNQILKDTHNGTFEFH